MTHKEISHVNKESIEHEDDLPNIDRGLTRHKRHIAWRRQKIFTMLVQGVTNTYELASLLHISQSTAARDVRYWKENSVEELKTHVRERLPFTYKICAQGLQEIRRYAWALVLQEGTRTNKIAALSLLAQSYKDQLEIATNASVITEALQQVERMKDKILASINTKQAISNSK
jgi:hypothetical protein